MEENSQDLNRWTEEWVYPNPKQQETPYYQHAEPKLGLDGLVYRLKVTFHFESLLIAVRIASCVLPLARMVFLSFRERD
jgi:hypothetical protein